jgi:peptide/nickel transport system ATP-binding protein
MASLPSLEEKETLPVARGAPPSLLAPPPGCVFHPRCPYVMERCKVEVPLMQTTGGQQRAACHLLDERQEANA